MKPFWHLGDLSHIAQGVYRIDTASADIGNILEAESGCNKDLVHHTALGFVLPTLARGGRLTAQPSRKSGVVLGAGYAVPSDLNDPKYV